MMRPSRSPSSSPAPAGQRFPVIFPKRIPKAQSPNLAPEQVIAELRAAVTSGDLDLNTSLQQIAEAAQALTGATGAAIAIRRNGAVVCMARAGETAPELGARLDVESGISGECLRTGKALRCGDAYKDRRVDVEVCRRLGLRSLAVAPLLGEQGVIGVLEVFSDLPSSFPDRHLQLLKRLAELVAAARIRFAGAEGSDLRVWLAAESSVAPRPSLWARANDALAPFLQKFHGLVAQAVDQNQTVRLDRLGMSGLTGLAVMTLALVTFFAPIRRPVFQGQPQPTRRLADRTVAVSNPGQTSMAFAVSSVPAGSSSESSASDLVFQAAARGPITSNRKPSPASAKISHKTQAVKMDEDLVLQPRDPDASSHLTQTQNLLPTSTTSQPATEQSPQEGDLLLASVPEPSTNPLEGVLSTNPPIPAAVLPVSQGISEGVVKHRVQPVYPEQARSVRLEGQVVLQATVTEDGAIRDLKVLRGHPVLARAAIEAVSQWRYRPYQLNGKPISMQTNITIDFKLP